MSNVDFDPAQCSAAIEESERFLETKNLAGCHKVLKDAYDKGCRDAQLLWRYGRSCYEMAEESTDDSVKNPLLIEGLKHCTLSVEKDNNNFASQKWMGILLSSQPAGTKEKIQNAFKIKEYFLKAIELNGNDPTSYHCMGKWCWSVCKISWIERQAASLIFATPPTSDYDECLKYLLKSAELGNTIHTSLLIGDVYIEKKNKEEAKKWYQEAIKLEAKTELQKRQQQEAQKKLSKC